MGRAPRRQVIIGLLLAATGLGAVLYLYGLASTLHLGDANIRGFILMPALPTPLYITMACVVCAGVGLTLVASFMQRRRQPPAPQQQRQSELVRSSWQMLINMLSWAVLLVMGILWLMRHGDDLRQWLERWSLEFGAAPELLAAGTRSLLRQVDSPTTGYALFSAVIVVYGGLALLALWVLFTGRQGAIPPQGHDTSQTRRVRRAVTAGLRELQQHSDPRQAIIACYARLEYLLEDHGVPAYRHLTPQEYMSVALRGLDLPMEALASLVALFEQARYSVHPLDNTARQLAITHLETIKIHLEWETALATRT